MNVTILISIRPYILICVLCLIAVSGIIAMCYKAYIHVPQKKIEHFTKIGCNRKGEWILSLKDITIICPKNFLRYLIILMIVLLHLILLIVKDIFYIKGF